MQKLLLAFILSCFSGLPVLAQDPALNCGNGRYISDITHSDNPSTVQYGVNTVNVHNGSGTITSTSTISLGMDIYEPANDPGTQKRPVVILAFGGGFIYNLRFQMEPYCRAFAAKGYVAVTIDYRKINDSSGNISWYYGNTANLADEVAKASSDMRAAIRYLKAHEVTYRIDPTKIFLGGYSSGAITAIQTAFITSLSEITNPAIAAQFVANGGLEGNTDLPAPDNLLGIQNSTSGIAGVFNISGGIFDLNWINAGDPPIYSMHGNSDGVVPYGSGSIGIPLSGMGTFSIPTSISFNGSSAIKSKADALGINNVLTTLSGGHTITQSSVNQTSAVSNAALLFQPIVCQAMVLPVSLISFTVQNENCQAALHWQTATEQGSNRYEIETGTDGTHFEKIGTVLSRNITSGANYAFRYSQQVNYAYFRLKMIDLDGHFTYSTIVPFRTACGKSQVQVYPNPAQSQTTVTGLEAGMQVELIDAAGQNVWTKKATGALMPIALSALTNGLYIIRVKDAEGLIISNSRLIINHH